MREASQAVIALLDRGQFVRAELYTFELVGGEILRFSGMDSPVTVDETEYPLTPLKFNRGKISDRIGLEVSELDVTILAGDEPFLDYPTFAAFARLGGLDGARFTLEYAFAADWPSPVISSGDIAFGGFTGSVKSYLLNGLGGSVANYLLGGFGSQPVSSGTGSGFGTTVKSYLLNGLAGTKLSYLLNGFGVPSSSSSGGPPSDPDTVVNIPTTIRAYLLNGLLGSIPNYLLNGLGEAVIVGNQWAGKIIRFFGLVSTVRPGRTVTEVKVKDMRNLLNATMPHSIYQAGCQHTLYDFGCSLNKVDFAVNGSVSSGSIFNIGSSIAQPDGYFDLGVVEFTSGPNDGVRRSVKTFIGGVFEFFVPLDDSPSAGDSFIAWPGCDKLKQTCEEKFDNLIHFRGFPFIPVPETAR